MESEPTHTRQNPRARLGFYGRNSKWILALIALLSPAYLWMSGQVLTPGDMSAYLLDVSHWLPQDSLLIQDMEKFSEVVGQERGNVVRISWPDCTASDPRLADFASDLRQLTWGAELSPDDPKRPVFVDVITIEEVFEKIKENDARLSDNQINRQLKNVMIGPNGTTCVIASLATREPARRSFAISEIYNLAERTKGLGSQQIKLFGGPVYTKKIDESGLRIATRFTPFSMLISVVCAWFCLRNFSVIVAVFLNAIVGTCAALVSLYVSDAAMDPLLMLMPGFWFIMSISAGMHFVNYYFETHEQSNDVNIDTATRTVAIAFKPTFLATLTTCIGLSSLCTSEILPLWRFGFHASVGLGCSFISLFLFLPSFLFLIRSRLPDGSAKTSKFGDQFWRWYGDFIKRFRYKTALVFILLIALSAVGFSRLGFSNKLKDQFSSRSKINLDTAWFEDEIGPVIPFELLVRFPKDNLPRPSECLGYIQSLQDRIDEMEFPSKTLSATSVVPYESGTGARQAMRRAILDKRIEGFRGALANTGYVIDEPDAELWRLSVFAYNSSNTTMNDCYSGILRAIDAQKRAYQDVNIEPKFSFAGLGSRMAVITRKLGGGLMQSCFTSAVLIALVVIIALRSVALGLTAMIPNIFPIVFSFGIFGFFQPSLDIGSIMTASIAMGIAVDDTIHFMYWFRQGIQGNLSRVESIQLAIRKCGRAIASTSLICGFGFFVFFFCDFMPVARFGQLLFMMLGAALIGDLFFLPALLRALPDSLLKRQRS